MFGFKIFYLYTANGTKLKKKVITPVNTDSTTYASSFVYDNETLSYVLFDEGRLLESGGTYEYQYFLRVVAKRKSRFFGNHLGNTRVTFSGNTGLIQQQDHYYPFGMNFSGIANAQAANIANQYKYNGKELQADLDLNWYDYGGRFYDPQIARWHAVDPMAEKYFTLTPYSYVVNNPISLIDPNGEDPIDPRTGKPFYVNLWRDGVSTWNEKTFNPDKVLFRRVDGYNFGKTDRRRGAPDGLWEGAKSFKHKTSISETSSGAKAALSNVFNLDRLDSFGAPCDYAWGEAALSGNYTFLNSNYSESEWLKTDLDSYNVVEVQDNYISKSATLTKGENGEFNLESVTSFNIEKGDVQTRTKKTWFGGTKTIKYRTLNVTQTTQNYKNNQASGDAISKTYQTEEIIK